MAGWRKGAGTALGALAGLLLFGGVGLLLLLKHTPSYFARVQEQTPERLAVHYDHFSRQRNEAINAFNNDPVYRLRVTDGQVNAWLAREVMVTYRHTLPPWVTALCVRFARGRLLLIARVEQGLLSSVVQVELRPQAAGTHLLLAIERVRAGALPLPAWLIGRLWEEAGRSASDWLQYDERTQTVRVRLFKPTSRRSGGPTVDRIEARDGILTVEGRTGR